MELLAWAENERLAVGVVGSGSNLLVADAGFRGLAMKLDGALATIEQSGDRLLCGGGARLPAGRRPCRPRRPGGPRVRREHPRHGRRRGEDERERVRGRPLARARVGGRGRAEGLERREPDRLGFSYRRSNLGDAEVVARASFALAPAPPAAVKATLAELRAARHEAQPSGIKTFGSTFKNPEDPRAGGRSAGRAARRGGLPRAGGRAAPGSRRSTRTSWRTWATPPRPTWWR